MANESKKDAESAPAGSDAHVRSKFAEAFRGVADAIEKPTKVGGMAYTASMVSLAILAALGALIGLFNSKMAEQLLNWAVNLVELMFEGTAGAVELIRAQRPKVQKIVWLYGAWVIGTVVLTIIAIATPWVGLSDTILIALAMMPYIMAIVIQVVVGGVLGKRELSLSLGRQFAIVSIVEFLIASGILFLPEGLRFYVVTVVVLISMGVCAHATLLGHRTNVLYHLMLAATIVMAVCALGVHTLDTLAATDGPIGVMAQDTKSALHAIAYTTAGATRDEYLAEYVVIQEGNLEMGKDKLAKLTVGTKLYRDASQRPKIEPGLPYKYAVTVVGGDNDGKKGFVFSNLIKPVEPEKPKVAAAASVVTPTTPTPVPAPAAAPAPTLLGGPLEETVTAEQGDWSDIEPTGLIPQAGDMIVMGPLQDPKDFRRLQSAVGLNAKEALTPTVFDNPGGEGFIGKNGITRNLSGSPMRFRVTEGEAITLKVQIHHGEFAAYKRSQCNG